MGSTVAAGFAEAVEDGTWSLETAISAHLTGNYYPPIHRDFHPLAVKAVKLFNEDASIYDGVRDPELHLPNGKTVTVTDTIRQLHLEAFITNWEE